MGPRYLVFQGLRNTTGTFITLHIFNADVQVLARVMFAAPFVLVIPAVDEGVNKTAMDATFAAVFQMVPADGSIKKIH